MSANHGYKYHLTPRPMTSKAISIQRVIDDNLCIGCGLCTVKNVKITMAMGEDGFLKPSSDDPGVLATATIEDICPSITYQQDIAKKGMETIYGPLLSPLMTGHAVSAEVRKKSSSGGAITAILLYLLHNKIIDAVLHVGKGTGDPTINEVFLSRTPVDIIRNSGSRYGPSSLLANLASALSNNSSLAIVGKPCDIAGVKNYLKNRPSDQAKVAITISFMCMGLPSQNATRGIISDLNPNNDKVTDFWYRGDGWPGELTVCTENNQFNRSYELAWDTLGRATPFRCKICPDGFGELADISSGDAWHVKNGGPSFENESDGRSLVFVRTKVGQRILNQAVNGDFLNVSSYDIRELKIIQKYQVLRKIYSGLRFFLLKTVRCHYLSFRGMSLVSNLRFATPRIFIGEIRGFFDRYRKHYQ